jgi:hypothetical protein
MTTNDTEAVPLVDVVYVLQCARDGWPDNRNDWTSDGFASAAWNGFLAQGDAVALTDKGAAFLDKFGWMVRR